MTILIPVVWPVLLVLFAPRFILHLWPIGAIVCYLLYMPFRYTGDYSVLLLFSEPLVLGDTITFYIAIWCLRLRWVRCSIPFAIQVIDTPLTCIDYRWWITLLEGAADYLLRLHFHNYRYPAGACRCVAFCCALCHDVSTVCSCLRWFDLCSNFGTLHAGMGNFYLHHTTVTFLTDVPLPAIPLFWPPPAILRLVYSGITVYGGPILPRNRYHLFCSYCSWWRWYRWAWELLPLKYCAYYHYSYLPIHLL